MLNKVMIIGNLGRDPEMRFAPSGKAVADFSVAVNVKYGEKVTTEWFNVVCWNKIAESCNKFLTKGSKVYVEGRQQTHSWEGQDGEKKYKTELIASRVIFLDSRKHEQQGNEPQDDDIPY